MDYVKRGLMSNKLLLAICGYVDGKHESQVKFSLGFPGMVNQFASEHNLNLEGRLISLVGCDEMSRKQNIHATIPMVNTAHVTEYDTIFDRIGTIVPTAGIFLDNAVYSGAQVFNRPISIDESKARDYMLAGMLGFNVPRTVVLPQACYIRARLAGDSVVWDIDLDDAVRQVGGYPCFLKKANGGGRAHVYKIHNKAELLETYQMTRELLMVLQEGVEFEKYIRTFCLGTRVVHTCYDIDKPDGQKYSWPTGILTDEERAYLDRVVPALAGELLTPFCTMEITKNRKDGNWYFIDITNGCNFDMREGELGSSVFQVVAGSLIEEMAQYTYNPRPMVTHTHLQEYVLRQQLYRSSTKGQNPDHLWRFAKEHGYAWDGKRLETEAARFRETYAFLHGL